MAELKIKADTGAGTVSWKGPNATTSNAAIQLTLPVDDGAANTWLKSNGSGVTSWAAPTATEIATSSGTAGSGTFLRGDNTWAAAGGGKVLQVVHVQSTGSNYFDADNAFMDIPNTTITVTTTKLNSKIMIQWNSGIAVTTSGGDIDEVSFRVRRSIGGVDADVREDNQWSYFSHSNSWHGPGQFHMMHLDSLAQAASTAVQYKLMGLVQQTNGKIYIPYGESGQANNMQIVAMELDT